MYPHDTAQLAEQAGVGDSTILKWKRKGFFEDCLPHRTGDGKTTGAGYRWSHEAMARVEWIVAQRNAGFSMEQILATLQAEHNVPKKAKRRGR